WIKVNTFRAQYGRFFYSRCEKSDFALLELEDLIDDDSFTSYICLAHRHIIRQHEIARLIGYGWGADPSQQLDLMNNLQVINYTNLSVQERCVEAWRQIPEDALCTMENQASSTCWGDSGGGLAAQGKNGQWTLLGILSFGSDCKTLLRGRPVQAQFYTDISDYIADIDSFTAYKDAIKRNHFQVLLPMHA
ncbi:unnamed protein product, partial [Gongylonema pulchrum]|uniref:Peptidase S1 domain-containing protein n=1 Tax=Gongylonema pulchrum TaxID=637853 RepID=A0A183DCY7_9BILA